jgi:putative mRNA 3-end processing factor
MKRRARKLASVGVSWRDGLHVLGTAVWCDARRARAVCFVSSADRTGRAGHGQLIATAETLALLGARADSHLAAPLRRPFTLGTVRLELLPSGYAIGAAGLVVDTGGHRVLYAGAVAPRGRGLGGTAELRPSDTLVVAAPYGAVHHRFDAGPADVVAFAREVLDDGAVPIVLVTSPLKGLDVAAALATAGVAVAAHRRIVEASRRLSDIGVAIAVRRTVASGRALVWLLADHPRASAAVRGLPARVALASGLAVDLERVRAIGVDRAIAWSSVADRTALLEFVASSSATDVAVTGPWAEEIARAIGPRARVLGPPRQLPLFA